MENVLFSIVIPTYNRAELLRRCLNSVEAQTYKNWEAIVVDNYSEDNTEEVVQSFNDSRIIYVKNHNYGVIAVSRNKAIDMANGDWIAFLDSDDYWLPKKLEVIMSYTRDYDLVYHGSIKNVKLWNPLLRPVDYFYDVKDYPIHEVLKRGDPISPSCAAVSMVAIGETRFDEGKQLFAVEDYDFFLQLIDKQLRIKYLKTALTSYDVSTGVSHGRIALDRDRQLFLKYMDRMSKEDLREIIKYYYYRKGQILNYPGNHAAAAHCFRIAASAKTGMVRWKAFKSMVKAYILSLKEK